MLFKRFFFLIFIVLFLVILAEIVYYFYYQPVVKREINQRTQGNISLTTAVTQTNNNQAVDEEVIKSLKVLKKGVLSSAILSTEYKGTITNLDISGSKYAFSIRIQEKGQSNGLNFDKNDMSKTKIFEYDNNKKEKLINAGDLKIRDKVIIKITQDLLKDIKNNTLSVTINKL